MIMNKYKSLIAIIDSVNLCELYQDKIKVESSINLELIKNEETALQQLELLEPDIIIITDMLSSINRFELCERLRVVQFISRPVIIFVSHSNDSPENKIEAFVSGADDYLTFSMQTEEFSIRIIAHLRRHIEELSNQNTKLPGVNLVNTYLKRAIKEKGYLEPGWWLYRR